MILTRRTGRKRALFDRVNRDFPRDDFLYLAKDGQFPAIGNRRTREWKIIREVLPHGDFAKVGDALFFLTGNEATRGMSSISLRDQTITSLASKRRTPPQTPLDRPDSTAIILQASAAGLIEVFTQPFDPANNATALLTESQPISKVIFDPAKKTWKDPEPDKSYATASGGIPPLTAAGTVLAYKMNPNSNVWTLQLPRAEMPKSRVPIEFVAPVGNRHHFGNRVEQWYWIPSGYIVISSHVWFIPQSELDAYLDTHTPTKTKPAHARHCRPGKQARDDPHHS